MAFYRYDAESGPGTDGPPTYNDLPPPYNSIIYYIKINGDQQQEDKVARVPLPISSVEPAGSDPPSDETVAEMLPSYEDATKEEV